MKSDVDFEPPPPLNFEWEEKHELSQASFRMRLAAADSVTDGNLAPSAADCHDGASDDDEADGDSDAHAQPDAVPTSACKLHFCRFPGFGVVALVQALSSVLCNRDAVAASDKGCFKKDRLIGTCFASCFASLSATSCYDSQPFEMRSRSDAYQQC